MLLLATAPVGAATIADPTAPTPGSLGASGPTGKAALTLNATYIGKADRYAIINGVKLREGESLGRIRLQRIRHKSVDITADGRKQSLQLHERIVKTP